ncbi:MAG: ribosome maturation factor RimM [Cyanobacteria bacterium K_DeepCast_35m_m2_023]|nr:ribosome maturation factor RimM [Cyanobacteria bacterium K_DeepCast_35m_m2_023]
METPEDLLVVGKVVAAQGLRGELRILPLSDFPERFVNPGQRWLRKGAAAAQACKLIAGRQLPGKELFVCRLQGIDDRDAAEALVGHELLVDASDRPALAPGEFHMLDLVGLAVRLLGGAAQGTAADTAPVIGSVVDLLHAGNDLLEVELTAEAGGRRIVIPFVEAIVPEVQIEQGWIGITPPPGLLEL